MCNQKWSNTLAACMSRTFGMPELHTSIMASAILVVIRAQYYTSAFVLYLKRENTPTYNLDTLYVT